MLTVETAVGPRRKVILTGTPRLISPSQGHLDASDRIIAYLKPKGEAPNGPNEADATRPPDDAAGLAPVGR